MTATAITIDTLRTATLEAEREILRLLTTLETSGVSVRLVYLERADAFSNTSRLKRVRLDVTL